MSKARTPFRTLVPFLFVALLLTPGAMASASEPPATGCERFDFRDEVGGGVPFFNVGLGDGQTFDEWMTVDGVQVYGQSSDLYHGNDNGTFLYRELQGYADFRVETPVPEQFDYSNSEYQKGGLMVRFGLDPLAPRVMAMLVNLYPNGPSIQFDVRTAQGATATEMASTIPATGIDRLAIERIGDLFVVEASSDGGASWFQPLGALGGQAVLDTTGLGDPLAGMAVASYETTNDVGFLFPEFDICGEDPPPTPPPIQVVDGCLSDGFDDDFVDQGWDLLSLGDADQVSIDESGGHLRLTGDGSSLFSAGTDHGGFAHRALAGDFRVELTTDVSAMGPAGSYRKGGLMIRTGLGDSDLRFIAQLLPDWNDVYGPAIQFRYRAVPGARGDLNWASDRFDVPTRVRFAVERRGDTLTAFYSFDEGATWIQPVGGAGGVVTINGLPETLYVGPNVVSYDAAVAATSAFDDFELCAPAVVGGLVWWDQDGDAQQDEAERGNEKVQLELRTPSNQPVFTTYTDADGRFFFPDVPPGDYRLLIDSPLRMSGSVAATVDPDGVEDFSDWEYADITVTPGQQKLDYDFGWRSDYRYNSACFTDDFEDGLVDTSWTSNFWFLTDFGDADQVVVSEAGGELTLASDGSSLYADDDHGAYLFQAWTGDFRIEVDVDGTDALTGGPYRKGGLMVRPDFDADGPRLISQLVPYWKNGPDAALQFRYRAAAGGPGDGAWGSNIFGVARTVRLAIERQGDTFLTEFSYDGGATWNRPAGGALGELVLPDWPETVMVGLNAVSYSASTATEIDFDDFSLCP